jgi:hypothetical protein
MERTTRSPGDRATAATAAQTATIAPAPSPGARDGSVTIGQLIDAYMAAYAGRDTTRHQRLGFWHGRFGSTPLLSLSDDDVFAALEDLASHRGRYYAGKDADGRPVMKSKRKPLSPASLNRYQAALSAVLTWAQRRRLTPKDWHNPCRNLELRPEKNEIVRFLSDDERTALLQACKASK